MLRNNFELSVLVNGNEVREYEHEGMIFVEGKTGTDFAIKIKNNTWQKVLAVITVDGKSVISGEAGNINTSPGYILEPHSSTIVPGWRINDNNIAKFVFVKKDDAYVVAVGDGEANVGIIGCAFFHEKREYAYVNGTVTWPKNWWEYQPTVYFTTDNADLKINPDNNTIKINGTYCTTSGQGTTKCTLTSSGNGSAGINSNGNSWGTVNASCTTTDAAYSSEKTRSAQSVQDAGAVSDNQLGTGFGQKQHHAVYTSQFNRENAPQTVIEVYYDTREGLKAKGVQLTPRARISGSAFPANDMVVTGCQPPKGWRG